MRAQIEGVMLVSGEDLERSLDVARAGAAGAREGLFGPASAIWHVNREAAIFLGAGRALLLQLAHPWDASTGPSVSLSRWCLARSIRPWPRHAGCTGAMRRLSDFCPPPQARLRRARLTAPMRSRRCAGSTRR